MSTTVTLERMACPQCAASVRRPFHRCPNCGTDFVQVIEKHGPRSVADIDRHLLRPHERVPCERVSLSSEVVFEQLAIDRHLPLCPDVPEYLRHQYGQLSRYRNEAIGCISLGIVCLLPFIFGHRGVGAWFSLFVGVWLLLWLGLPIAKDCIDIPSAIRQHAIDRRQKRVLEAGQEYDPQLETHVAKLIMQADDSGILEKAIKVFNYLGEHNEFCDDLLWITRNEPQWRISQESDGKIVFEARTTRDQYCTSYDVGLYVPGQWEGHLDTLFLKAENKRVREEKEAERKEAEQRRSATDKKRGQFPVY